MYYDFFLAFLFLIILTHTATDSTITAVTNAICPISIVYKDKLGNSSDNKNSNLIKIPERTIFE